MKAKIVLLPGDGIGPEVVGEAVRVLDCVASGHGHSFDYVERLMGGCSIDKFGSSLTDETLADCQAADAVLLGAVGGPKWDDPKAKDRPERGLLALRKGLKVFANLRPVKVHPALIDASPLKPEKLRGVDILVIRELTGGLYFGFPKGRDVKDGRERAVDTLEYYDYEVRRVVELAFRLARDRKKKVTSVDKANVLESSRLWRQIATGIGAQNPDITLEHVLVDTASMRLVTGPAAMDVVVTENMFGDILTDEASVLAGSLGLLPSASLGEGT
ncbi:MAG TPA: 3-isopropylmalate dehydrogenase, partial [Anaerolineales bacterium]|nr:3-isopropylmalate dehydrogenase [Anaerolineales bacterium]